MNVYEAVKNAVTTRQAAEYYGIKVTGRGMTRCPFHHDRHPSMKLDRRFHCFGCQADGDVIDFVAVYFSLSVREAAMKLAEDFGIRYEKQRPLVWRKRKKKVKAASLEQNYGKLEKSCFSVLGQYREHLLFWKKRYAPGEPDTDWDSRFCEALDQIPRVEYLMDVLLHAPLEERVELLLSAGKEVLGYAGRLQELEAGTVGSPETVAGRNIRCAVSS